MHRFKLKGEEIVPFKTKQPKKSKRSQSYVLLTWSSVGSSVGSSSIAMNVTASTGREVSWLALCRLSWPRLRLTSKQGVKPSAGRKGRELSKKQAGRWCSQCRCKHWQAGKAQRRREFSASGGNGDSFSRMNAGKYDPFQTSALS